MGKRNQVGSVHTFLLQLDHALDSLPSAEEKAKLLEGLGRLRTLVEQLEQGLASVPTVADAEGARRAAAEVRAFIEKAQGDPVLALLLAGQAERRPRASRSPRDSAGASDSGALIEALSNMSVDEAQRAMEGDRYSATELRKIASGLGIRGVSKLPREAIAHQVAMKLANYRGYQQLSGTKEAP